MAEQLSLIGQLRLLEEQLLNPQVRKSLTDLTKLIADDFLEIGSSGNTFNKEQVIHGLMTSEEIIISMENFQVRLLAPDVALVTYKAIKDNMGEIKYSQRSSIWNAHNGSWQIVFHQGTPMAPKR